IAPERDTTAMIISLLRGEDHVPENRRPSCLSMTIVNGTLENRGSSAALARWWGLPAPRTTDSLWPVQVPRRSGIAGSATAGTATSAATVQMHANFDMAQPPSDDG